jgi:beta-galactosidase GanA
MVMQRMNYTFPLGDKLTITAGPIVRQDEMLGSWPVRYPTNAPLFGVPSYAGAPAAYNLNQGAGGAVTYRDKLLNSTMAATVMYISRWGENGNSGAGGIGTANSGAITTAQLGFSGSKWTVAGIYTYSQDNYASAKSQGTPA